MCAEKGLSKFLVLTLLVAAARPLQHIAYVCYSRQVTFLNETPHAQYVYRTQRLHLSMVTGIQLVRLDRLCPPFT
jgi:hypothetical protein